MSAAIPADALNVMWHDLECGSYVADRPLWRALAGECGDPVLDVGAGTGRIALDLARLGHRVTALDRDAVLLDELAVRADGLELDTVLADARSFRLERRFPLCIVPMQTIQLLGGADGRTAFLGAAKRHVDPGGMVAIALTEALEPYELPDGAPAPLPDIREVDGVVYASQPVAVREDADGYELERRREVIAVGGDRSVQSDRVHLDQLGPEQLEDEGREIGFTPAGRRYVPPTDDYVGSVVVMLAA
jgi:SAM-dependent methyltransferase